MKPYKGICKECKEEKWISNARCLCSECVYKANHGGKTRYEVAQEKEKDKTGKKVYKLERKPLKRSKTRQKLRNEKIEARREVLKKDRETYLTVFNNTPHKCEECGRPLPDVFEDEEGRIIYISQYSHVLSKGAFNEYRNEVWNFNRLCFDCHQMWDFGNKKGMKIYKINKQMILKNTGRDIL